MASNINQNDSDEDSNTKTTDNCSRSDGGDNELINSALPQHRENQIQESNEDQTMEEETSGFLDEENNSDIDEDKIDLSKSQLIYSPFQLVGDVIGVCRSFVRVSVILTGLYQHWKWERYSLFFIEILIIYTSSALQLLDRDRASWTSRALVLVGPIYSLFNTVYYHVKCIYHGIWVNRSKKLNLHGKHLQFSMESLARKSAVYWMTEDALLLGTSTLFLTLAHQADWLEFPIPNKFFLTKSINTVCAERTSVTSLNLPEWVLCFVRLLLPFFGEWPMDYLFITRIWILLWSCMWACDYIEFSWTLFIFPSVKGKRFRPGLLPQLHQAANRLMELGYRAFGIVLSGSVMVPVIFRCLTTAQYQDRTIYLNALYSEGYKHYHANITIINETATDCIPFTSPFDDCDRYDIVQYSITQNIHDISKRNRTLMRRDTYDDILQAVNASILIYCILIFSMTVIYHITIEYARWSLLKGRDLHVPLQKAVLFAPFSRYAWRQRSTANVERYRTAYICLQLCSIPCIFGLLSFALQDLEYDFLTDDEKQRSLSSSDLWQIITSHSGYPGGIFNYSSKFFHYYLQTNIFFVTLLPATFIYAVYAASVNIYFKLLHRFRNYEVLLYRTKYSKFYGAYK